MYQAETYTDDDYLLDTFTSEELSSVVNLSKDQPPNSVTYVWFVLPTSDNHHTKLTLERVLYH